MLSKCVLFKEIFTGTKTTFMDFNKDKYKNLEQTKPNLLLEAKMTEPKLLHFVHVIRTQDSLEKTIMLGKVDGGRERRQKLRWFGSLKKATSLNL